MPIVIQETQRAVFYAPFYAAFARNAYRDAGVEVEFKPAGAPADAVRGVLVSAVEVAWGGPMRVMVHHDRTGGLDLVCFCEAVTRDPFFLVGAKPRSDFRLTDLRNVRIGAVREVPTPWQCLQEDLRFAGVKSSDIAINFDRDMRDNVAALRSGELDAIQTLEPFAEQLVEANLGYIWHAAAVRGHTSYTSFYTRRAFLAKNRNELVAMTRAVFTTQAWLHRSPPDEIAATIAPYFATVPQSRLGRAIARYKVLGVWGADPRLPRSGYERLQGALLSGGLIRTKLPFESAVDNSLAEEVMSAIAGTHREEGSSRQAAPIASLKSQ